VSSRAVAFCLRGASQGDGDLYVMINAGTETVRFDVQAAARAPWRVVIDTAQASPRDVRQDGPPLDAPWCRVEGRSVVVLEASG
jgi:glycogen operon protein